LGPDDGGGYGDNVGVAHDLIPIDPGGA
jgi:hypothetical protein